MTTYKIILNLKEIHFWLKSILIIIFENHRTCFIFWIFLDKAFIYNFHDLSVSHDNCEYNEVITVMALKTLPMLKT